MILLPGPNSLFVLATSAQRGVATGYRAACGVFLGDAVLMLLSALGVASLLKAEPMLFIGLKYLGAAYLFYLGVGMLRGAWRKLRNPEATAAQAEQVDVHQPFRKALLLSLSNPKAILFSSPFHPVRRSRLCLSGPVVPGAGGDPGTGQRPLPELPDFHRCAAGGLVPPAATVAGATSGVGALFVGFGEAGHRNPVLIIATRVPCQNVQT